MDAKQLKKFCKSRARARGHNDFTGLQAGEEKTKVAAPLNSHTQMLNE